MGLDYQAIALDAAAAIADAGMSITIRRPAADRVFDPVEGEWTGGGAPVDTVALGVVLPSLPGWTSTHDAALIEPGDQFILLEAGGVEPVLTDRAIAEGREYQIVEMERLAPAGVPVLYTLRVRP